jgi:rhodanese-related sulfurtransferase
LLSSGTAVIDARHWDEMRDTFHLNGSLPSGFLQRGDAELLKLNRDTPYLLVCPLGERSALMAQHMHQLGFKQLHHLKGGLRAWLAAGLEMGK